MALEDRLRHVSVWVQTLERWKVYEVPELGGLWLFHDCMPDLREPRPLGGSIALEPGVTTLADLLGKTIAHRCPPRSAVHPSWYPPQGPAEPAAGAGVPE